MKTHVSEGLASLVRANEPFWGGEAEVIRSYWDSPTRSRETDKKWLVHQIYKEYWHGIRPSVDLFNAQLPRAGVDIERAKLLKTAEVLHEEVQHFSLFAGLYLVLEGVDFALCPEELKVRGSWPEDDELMQLRERHRTESAALGERAYRFTEGGHCALFTEGMKLVGRGGFDDALAGVCRQINEDEFNHMLLGIIGLDDAKMSPSDWDTLICYTVAQMKMRIVMRDAQFSHPVSKDRLAELLAGKATPAKFDSERAAPMMNSQ